MRFLTLFTVFFGLRMIADSATLHAGSASIGVALSGGGVLLNDYKTAGNATIFEANSIETLDATCRIQLAAGGWVVFGERSSGHVYPHRLELQTGSVRVSGYDAIAAGLQIHAIEKAVGTISMRDGMVEVASITGVLQVLNTSGATVLNVRSGQVFNLQPGAAHANSLVARGLSTAVLPAPHPNQALPMPAATTRVAATPPATTTQTPQTPHTAFITGGVSIYAASEAHGIRATVAHEKDEPCLSADRDCKHGRDPGDDGHGHGNDDHGGDHGRGH